jgi:DNA-binding MarR family transcriptional regulator
MIMGYYCCMNEHQTNSGLYDHTGYWLRRLSNLVHQTFERKLADFDITVSQWNVLVALYRGDATTPLDLARFIDIDTGAVTRLVDRLVLKGLIVRVTDVTDRRSIRLELTEKGKQLVPQLIQRADENDQQFFNALTPSEHDQLKGLIGKLLAANGIETPEPYRNLL